MANFFCCIDFFRIFTCLLGLNMESQIGDLRYSAAIRAKELEKRIAHLENLVGWLTGLLIDLIAIAFGVAAAIFVAGDYYRLSSVDGAVVFAFLVAMFSVNFICRKVGVMVFPRPASRGTELIPRPKPQFGEPMGTATPSAVPFSRVCIQPAGHHHRVRISMSQPMWPK